MIGLAELCIKTLCLSDSLFVPDFKRNLVYVSCFVEHGSTMQFNSLVSIKSNDLSYTIKVIEYTDDEKLPLSKKRKFSNETYLWHLRLSHINHNRIHDLVKGGILNSLIFEPILVCELCLEGKMTKGPSRPKEIVLLSN